MTICGENDKDVLVGTSTGEVYYWISAEQRYINSTIQYASNQIRLSSVVADPFSPSIYLISNFNDIHRVSLIEDRIEEFDPHSTCIQYV